MQESPMVLGVAVANQRTSKDTIYPMTVAKVPVFKVSNQWRFSEGRQDTSMGQNKNVVSLNGWNGDEGR